MKDQRVFMNPAYGRHIRGEGAEDVSDKTGQHRSPHISIHSHSRGHTVHIMHHDGRHEKFEHDHGDSEGIAEHIHRHLGGRAGQDHGYSAGERMENEESTGGPGV